MGGAAPLNGPWLSLLRQVNRMIWDRTNHPVWLRCTVGVLVAGIAAAIRFQFLGILELRVPFLTFYPAVAVAALYGGLGAGLLATVVSAALADYFWMEPVGHLSITNSADLISMVVFLASGVLISYLAEATYRAQVRANKAEEQAKLADERQKAAVDLQQSESKYRELVQNANSAIIRWKCDGTIAFFNEYAQKFFGYSEEEVIGKNVNILVPEQESTGGNLTGLIQDIANHPEKYANNINENILRDGGRVWMAWTNRPIFDQNGQVLEILAIGSDITERRKAEEQLRRSWEWFRVTLSSIGDAVIATDASGLITFLNPVAAKLTGWEPGVALHQPIQNVFRIINEQSREPAQNVVERVLREGNIVNLANHTVLITRDGREIPIEDSAAPIRDGAGNLIGVVLVFHDVTEKRRTQEVLKQSEEYYRSLFDNMLNGYAYCRMLFEVDEPKDFIYLNVNRAFETLTGLENVIGKKISEIIPGILETDRELLEIYGRVATTGVPERFETYVEALGMWFSISVYSPRKEHFVAVFDVITERKLAEEELLRAKKEWEQTFDSVPDLIAILDTQHRVVRTNRAMAKRLGVTPEQCVGLCCCESVHGSLEPPEFCPHSLTLSDGQEHIAEVHEERLGGDFLVSTTPFKDDRGVLIGTVHVARDITERKRIEEELRKSRDELESRVRERTAELVSANEDLQKQAALLNLAHDAIFVVDSVDVVSFWNNGAEDLYGFTREQVIGNVACEFLQTRFPESFEQVVNHVIDSGQWAGELRQTTSSGEELVVESRWALRRGEDGKPTGFLIVNRDITARKIIEEELRKTDRAFRALSECNQAMMRQTEERELLQQVCRIVVDVGGYRMAWVGFAGNDESKSVLPIASAGYDHGYLGQAQIAWADTERGRGPTGTAIRTGKIVTSQNALINPSYEPWRSEGTRRGYISSIAFPLIVESEVIGALTIYASELDAFDEGEASLLSNLAENLAYGIASIRAAEQRRRSEEELRVYASRLELVNAELQEFAFIASHDLQEPLRKIQTFCDMAQKRCAPVLDDTAKDYLDRVFNSASRMRQLLRDLLEFSRVATRSGPFKQINLVEIVLEAADVFEASVKETGCQIEVGNIPAIEADATQMLGLFQNLIGNALKFRGDATPSINVYSELDGRGICEIFIKDNGIGFAPQFTELIFKPFQRLHSRNEYEGTGMGLSICRKIVERHGGNIRAESEPGKGSTFIIRLPVKQDRCKGI